MGVDSGLPDFRGNEGFWKAHPLLKQERLSFQDLANPQWFEDDPNRAWGFYGHRFHLYKKVEPHRGFSILQDWGRSKGEDSFVFTSNVDGHFQKSGFHPDAVYECHGSINYLQCQHSCGCAIWSAAELDLAIDNTRLMALGALPRCPSCSAVARPNILMFGDCDWLSRRSEEQHHRFQVWQRRYSRANIVTVEIGAGKEIPTARYAADDMPGTTIRINPRDSEGNRNTLSIPMGALQALENINQILNRGI